MTKHPPALPPAPTDNATADSTDEGADSGPLRRQAEAVVAHQAAAGPLRPARELAHELQVHRIELEMQNDELRRVQADLEAARDRYIDLFDFAPVGYLTLDAVGCITDINLTGARMLGEERRQLMRRRFARHVAEPDGDRWHRYTRALARPDAPRRIEVTLVATGGQRFEAQVDGLPIPQPSGPPTLRLALTDVTARKQAEAELRLAAIAFQTQEGIMITNAQGVIERVNHAFTQITGYNAEEVVGKTGRLLQSGMHPSGYYAQMWDSLLRTGAWQGEIYNRRKNGEIYPEWLSITAVNDPEQAVTRYVGTMLDISLRKAREQEVAQLAFYDPLTGLPNRRLMKDRLEQLLAASARSLRHGALIFIDLDHFKDINDTLGHDKGDHLLQQVAQRLSANVRAMDTVARLGGDEFVVMLGADLSPLAEEAALRAKATAEQILSALNKPYAIGSLELTVSASVGVALFCDAQDSVDDLLKRADLAMYQAKAAGRNTLRFFDTDVQQAMTVRTALESDLRLALRREELQLYYQPVVDAQRGLLGAEALVRWEHPTQGLIGPDAFISIAEDRGLIHPLGLWVMTEACTQLARWAHEPAMAALTLSVNVSARELRDTHFVEQVLEVLRASGADPSRLKLELTESTMLDNMEQSIDKMNLLRARGVGFALDDFGTGFASLTYLRRLPLQQIKIDRSFVHEMMSDTHDAVIARTIVNLGQNLGVTVIAEGVETEAQQALLVDYGCTGFQGFLFGRPMPLEAWLGMARAA
jgi:diguanylate cyclase (GGDEF)-like protein/PAS domain S-box-containing protein